MRKYTKTLIAGAALALSGAALANSQSESGGASAGEEGASAPAPYTMKGTISDISLVGGTGTGDDRSYGASWSEKIAITSGDNVTMVTAKCIGMDQPDNSLFERHVTCSASDGNGQEGGMIFGCNVESSNTMSCVGYFQGLKGGVKDHVSLQTAFYTFSSQDAGTMRGTGQWIR